MKTSRTTKQTVASLAILIAPTVTAQTSPASRQTADFFVSSQGQDLWSGCLADPDMLVVGYVGWGKPHPTGLTPDEQYTHISIWCLVSAPLLLGCDMEKLDEFTLSLLTNDEVLAVSQDLLGKQATCVSTEGELRVYVKDLEDGSKAIGLFNLGDKEATVIARWSDLKLSGKLNVRDLWRQKDLGQFDGQFQAAVSPHGAEIVKTGHRAAR